MTIASIIFYILAAITLGTAFMTVTSRNPVNSAVYMILCFFSIAGHMLILDAQFLALVQILVYSGAIMVLLIFTLMLMNLKKEDEPKKHILSRVGAAIAAGMTLVVVTAVLVDSQIEIFRQKSTGLEFQSAKIIGDTLINKYLVPFEFVSILLIAAMVGAVLVSQKSTKDLK